VSRMILNAMAFLISICRIVSMSFASLAVSLFPSKIARCLASARCDFEIRVTYRQATWLGLHLSPMAPCRSIVLTVA
jgi:hypothetical protein